MKLLLSGEIDGNIRSFYDKVSNLQAEWCLCTGSFGAWPDKRTVDRGTRNSVGPGDFASLYVKGFQAPLQTVFVSGVHEDHNWLKKRQVVGDMEVLSGIHWLANGYRTSIGNWDENIRVTGFGKVYSEATFNGIQGKRSHRHYTQSEFEKACSSGPTDVLLFHERPTTKITHRIIFATQPKLIVYSSPRLELETIMGRQAIGLSKSEVYLFDTKLFTK
jgi:hypothetical protein